MRFFLTILRITISVACCYHKLNNNDMNITAFTLVKLAHVKEVIGNNGVTSCLWLYSKFNKYIYIYIFFF